MLCNLKVNQLLEKKICHGSIHKYEDKIKETFVKSFNSLIESKEEIIKGYEDIIEELLDRSKLDKHSATIQSEMEIAEELLRKMVDENVRKVMEQKEYSQR